MSKIKWLSSFETGLPEIDDDHRELVDKISSIEDTLEQGNMQSCVDLFKGFLSQAEDHFKREEAFLISIDFPYFEAHCASHRKLLEMAGQTLTTVETGMKPDEAKKCLEEMTFFLLEDVIRADAEFRTYAQEKGVI